MRRPRASAHAEALSDGPEAGRFLVRAIRTAFVVMAIVIVLLAAAVVILLIGGPVGHVVAIRTAEAAPVVLTNPLWLVP